MQHDSYIRVRVPSGLKERLKLQGVDISEVVRVALEGVVKRDPKTLMEVFAETSKVSQETPKVSKMNPVMAAFLKKHSK